MGLGRSTFSLDAGKQSGGGFVLAAFAAGEFGFGGDEFAPEGFGQDCLAQFVSPFCCHLDPFFDGVEQGRTKVSIPDSVCACHWIRRPHYKTVMEESDKPCRHAERLRLTSDPRLQPCSSWAGPSVRNRESL